MHMATVDVLPAVPSKKFPIQATPALLISRNSVVPSLRDGKGLTIKPAGGRQQVGTGHTASHGA